MWGVTPRWINYYCSAGRIPGAEKMGTVWLIHKNATKPLDGRRKSAGQSGGEHHD
ncbi:DNA-binding protein [Eubacterium ramulus]|uniref:DNA-binding protein n=1 Tax=Eubacterium ramulus TaxID=39490 RepID=UPI003C6DA143